MTSHVIINISEQVFEAVTGSGDESDSLGSQVMSVKITDASGKTADTCEIELNDMDDQIVMPRKNAPIEVILYRDDKPGAITFSGWIGVPSSRGARGSGQVILIEAKAADMRSGLKIRKEKHLDDSTFEQAAQAFAPDGVTVKIAGELGQIRRDYWYLGRENFMHWAQRTAAELGATFKIMGTTAVFVPMNSGQSVSGKPLQTIEATKGVNIISWDMSPENERNDRDEFEVTWYDPADAKWKTQDGTVKVIGRGNTGTYGYSAADQDTAGHISKSLKKKKERERGGGEVTIDGEPAAQAEALCVVTIRPGISGTYLIDKAEHRWTRKQGFLTKLDLKMPKDAAGTDDRDSSDD